MKRNLWLNPRPRHIMLPISRWEGYPHFWYTIHQYENLKIPAEVTVSWIPLTENLLGDHPVLDTENTGEQQTMYEHIERVKDMIRTGEDVPPLVIEMQPEGGYKLFDGRHRGWAALQLGLKKAPVIEISLYWKPK